MLRFQPLPPEISDIRQHLPQASAEARALVDMMRGQSETVISQVIAGLAGRLDGPHLELSHWLVAQPMELATAIRLFWALYRPGHYVGLAAAINDRVAAGPDRLHLLKTLSENIAAGAYPRGGLGISPRQSKLLKIQLVQQTQEARFRGWDQLRDAGFDIPEACLMPLTGRMLCPIAAGEALHVWPKQCDWPTGQHAAYAWAAEHLTALARAGSDLPEAQPAQPQRRGFAGPAQALVVSAGLVGMAGLVAGEVLHDAQQTLPVTQVASLQLR